MQKHIQQAYAYVFGYIIYYKDMEAFDMAIPMAAGGAPPALEDGPIGMGMGGFAPPMPQNND
jgi:hypothetical protein